MLGYLGQPFPCTDPDDIHIYMVPWVTGTRTVVVFGTISHTQFTVDGYKDWEKCLDTAFDNLQQQAALLGGSSIVNLEIQADPFATLEGVPGLEVTLCGSVAYLESF